MVEDYKGSGKAVCTADHITAVRTKENCVCRTSGARTVTSQRSMWQC